MAGMQLSKMSAQILNTHEMGQMGVRGGNLIKLSKAQCIIVSHYCI